MSLYMAEHRYPVTRSQVINLAWAIAKQAGKANTFSDAGPTLKWWRGSRDRHPELSLRKPESVDRGRATGIYPLDRNAVQVDMILRKTKSISAAEANAAVPGPTDENHINRPGPLKMTCIENKTKQEASKEESLSVSLENLLEIGIDVNECNGEEIASLGVEMVEEAPVGAEVLLKCMGQGLQPCPPQLALNAIEKSLTEAQRSHFQKRYENERNSTTQSKDPTYITWSILQKKVESFQSPLVTSGIIPPSLAEILTAPPDPSCHVSE